MAIYLSNSVRPVTTPAPTLPPAGRMATPLPATDLGTCEDCESELTALTNNAGEVRTTFCEYCEFGL
ncbi:hypothetical protein [Streptomyces europaeiscabiei]|uniref:hypothetical protein n=1 Tax=Streptomyces europaeiscabiei TaxID=146819 RepID=UPI002E10D643|nr:hypothetical protein OHB30_33200 [Streptomyces europaeiscabiei]